MKHTNLISSSQLCFCFMLYSFIPNSYLFGSSLITGDQNLDSPTQHYPSNSASTNSPTGIIVSNDKKLEEVLSVDCNAKREEILRRQKNLLENKVHHSVQHNNPTLSSGFQRLKPKLSFANETLDTNFGSEHIPRCTPNGRYEPTQCHKIGYCWCVNKYGQAIKNSAALASEKLHCDKNLYESESNNLLVVTGVSSNHMKNLLKVSTSLNTGSLSPSNQFEWDPETGVTSLDSRQTSTKEQESDFSRRVSNSPEPSLALVPNECTLSRQNAIERASKHTDDSIWIPECDSESGKLYAEKQCHKSRICWCVDQNTGLPLRTSEQLTKQTSINCTEIKRIIDIASTYGKNNSQKSKFSFFHGSSEFCDADKRIEFVQILINQFRRQLNEYLKLNPNYSAPEGLPSANPYRLSESQVSIWKFATMDQNVDGNLDDREWSKFKVNFKLVDKFEEIHKTHKEDFNAQLLMTPLNIVRAQRRCWRDFLQFCGNGDILTDESISMAKWLSCTEIPSKLNGGGRGRGRFSQPEPGGVPDAFTKAAAIARSKKKNPFLGILKSD